MHELGLCDAILKTVDQILDQENAGNANRIVISIGELSGVVPQFMTNCWTAVTEGTKYENLELQIERIPGVVQCMDCTKEFQVTVGDDLTCPYCGSGKLRPMSGMDMTIEQIEVADE